MVVEFKDAEEIINHLWQSEGWYVVSQSTVFLSESSGGWGGLSAGTKTEGLALVFRRDLLPKPEKKGDDLLKTIAQLEKELKTNLT